MDGTGAQTYCCRHLCRSWSKPAGLVEASAEGGACGSHCQSARLSVCVAWKCWWSSRWHQTPDKLQDIQYWKWTQKENRRTLCKVQGLKIKTRLVKSLKTPESGIYLKINSIHRSNWLDLGDKQAPIFSLWHVKRMQWIFSKRHIWVKSTYQCAAKRCDRLGWEVLRSLSRSEASVYTSRIHRDTVDIQMPFSEKKNQTFPKKLASCVKCNYYEDLDLKDLKDSVCVKK